MIWLVLWRPRWVALWGRELRCWLRISELLGVLIKEGKLLFGRNQFKTQTSRPLFKWFGNKWTTWTVAAAVCVQKFCQFSWGSSAKQAALNSLFKSTKAQYLEMFAKQLISLKECLCKPFVTQTKMDYWNLQFITLKQVKSWTRFKQQSPNLQTSS